MNSLLVAVGVIKNCGPWLDRDALDFRAETRAANPFNLSIISSAMTM